MCSTSSSALLCHAKEFITGRLHIEPLTFGLLLLFFCSSLTCVLVSEPPGICVSTSHSTTDCELKLCGMICCCNRYRSSPSYKAARKRLCSLEAGTRAVNGTQLHTPYYANNPHHHSRGAHSRSVSSMGRRRLLNLMLARMEEFESLTPLMVTPTSTVSNSILRTVKDGGHSQRHVSAAPESSSPPSLTRRLFVPVGKTTIVPLTATNTRRIPLPPTVATAISSSRQLGAATLARIESGRATTTVTNKSCETIPEGDETASGNGRNSTSQVDDLLSIDRTFVSVLLDSAPGQQLMLEKASDVVIPASSSPHASLHPSPTTSYSSRNDAEAIGGSPMDETNGSFISGSFVNYPPECNGPCGVSTGPKQMVSDLSPSLLDCDRRFSLHMIEEESSEVASGSRATGGGGVNNSATMVTIMERGYSQPHQFIPRSISQQLEMMNLT